MQNGKRLWWESNLLHDPIFFLICFMRWQSRFLHPILPFSKSLLEKFFPPSLWVGPTILALDCKANNETPQQPNRKPSFYIAKWYVKKMQNSDLFEPSSTYFFETLISRLQYNFFISLFCEIAVDHPSKKMTVLKIDRRNSSSYLKNVEIQHLGPNIMKQPSLRIASF